MAKRIQQRSIEIPKGWGSSEAASFFAQLDALSETMFIDLRGIPAAELAWQPARGMNTVGMLLAHCAIVEAFWLMIATETQSDARLAKVLGIGVDDDGMPIPEGGLPPATLRGRTLGWYRRLHDRARRFAARTAKGLKPADMRRVITRTRRDGTISRTSVRWILYHVLEHQAGHYGQMLLLRHLHRDRRAGRRA